MEDGAKVLAQRKMFTANDLYIRKEMTSAYISRNQSK